jgi:D-3-phosphoglycerate dehydrogenase / 2-oxoglutarate reductase
MPKVLIADGLASEGLQKLKTIPGVELLEYSAIERSDLIGLLAGVDILIVRSRTQVDRDLLQHGKQLKIVLRAGIGLDNVDVAAATDRGVVVMNAPTGNIVTTAEHTLALIFAVSRHVAQADASLRQGKWEKKKFQGSELRNKVLGLVGLGNIGRVVAERALALGMTVLGHDPYLSAEAAAKHNIKLVSFEDLLKNSDYVSVHVPLTSSTKYLLGRDALLKMKKDAYLINCARGGIVEEKALIEVLEAGHLTGAALDVFETEPLPPDHPLLKRTDVVLTPHLGASTDEAQVQVSLEVAEEIGLYVSKGVLKNAINVPNVTVEQLELLRPYLDLGERLGSFSCQIAPQQSVKQIRIRYEGSVASFNRDILTLSILKGYLAPLLSETVNFVNVRKLLKERGIKVEESVTQECEDYASKIDLTVEGTETVTVSGTLFGKGEPRIVSIDHFAIDAIPTGYLLFTKNVDQPGVIGAMGSILGTHGINIARMHLGRDKQKAQAIALISVDSQIPVETLNTLRSTKGMVSVRQIKL